MQTERLLGCHAEWQQLPILACSDFTSIAGVAGAVPPGPKLRKRHPFPRRDLIGMNVERSASQSYRPVALDGGKRHLRVEGRCVVPARSSVHGLSVDSVFSAFRQKSHFPEPAL